MFHTLLTFLNHPVSSSLPLALQFSSLQLIAVLLAALASSRALGQMQGRSAPAVSIQVMLSVALLCIILASNLPENDARPDLGIALVLRLVVGGALLSMWNALHSRLKAVLVRSS
ncbi:hypothetical protein Q0M94_17665 (plasmid) [Deinococcus radiomollis]|uniref:hypothetical protein n=1 Tax=Deinococcus radiomollis TaxID=468916 RepID=UPI0038914E9E